MKALVEFLVRHGSWFTFLLFAIISCVMLFRGNPYQQHVYMTSAGAMARGVYSTAGAVTGYFHLRGINEDLQQRNAQLEMEVINLRTALRRAAERIPSDTLPMDSMLSQYGFIMAHVINNSIVRSNNFITIDKGELDGVMPDMGVVDQNGIVGIVNVTGPHTARLISVLSAVRLACKVKGSNAFGSLVWDGRSPRHAVLEELPRHVEFALGDTVVTSGYSVVFPEGIPVGKVIGQSRDSDDNFYSLQVELFTDFATLSTVRVIKNFQKDEIEAVEQDRINTSGKF
ncbi:MAG: rod shape-determining protein MreC [Muribaculaceae bacterium]|nr:rod shape-determining protein MreC [Muribaculaceae bacterium]MDE6316208.1 rod shape-determining protein MreC [Muribaculaceae bacterium]